MLSYIYIHVPFCLTKCGYCSFYSEKFSLLAKRDYLDTLKQEIVNYSAEYKLSPKTIYFGGGTPSLLSPSELAEILSWFNCDLTGVEITLETNPITITSKYVEELAKTDVNRVSLGIQSYIDKDLHYLGRKHKQSTIKSYITLLRDGGFTNISGDLMYGLPNQTLSDLETVLDRYLDLDLDHISIYCLSLDEDVPLYKDIKQLPDDDTIAEMYSKITTKLQAGGLRQYEISNFSKEGKESAHNLAYWLQSDYLGLGAGAFGTIGNVRYNNSESLTEWRERVYKRELMSNREILTELDLQNEYLMLHLRLNSGLDTELFEEKFGIDILTSRKVVIEKFLNLGLLEITKNRVSLTAKSRFISNYIISELMEES